jgi:3-methyladenine DNA glycosylase AlkD
MSELKELVKELLANLPAEPDVGMVVDLVTEAFERMADRGEYYKAMQTVVPGAGVIYGVRVPALRELAKGVQHAYKQDQEALKAIALASWEQGSREHELFGLFLLGYVKKLSPAERWALGERFLPQVGHWEACDQLCAALLGEALAQDAKYMDLLEGWVDAENIWVRRAALVATVYLRRAKFSPEVALDLDQRTLAMCARLLDDRERYIRKAVDWAIREVVGRHYAQALEWMMAQAAGVPSRTAGTTLKLASKKLSNPDRDAFLVTLGD